ncbi:hypothetical protein E2C01_015085 [Portunus trituberculatus]|uniref:Uncharacterized protein n=1 Tax=Portunus trituberculatus TaxID=210409 RepID=A0A5B7DKR2_PORTR|nr:hypothetical protein [Portunus trituberculatus]
MAVYSSLEDVKGSRYLSPSPTHPTHNTHHAEGVAVGQAGMAKFAKKMLPHLGGRGAAPSQPTPNWRVSDKVHVSLCLNQ